MKPITILFLAILSLAISVVYGDEAANSPKPIKITQWNGYEQHHFTVDGLAAWIVKPKTPAAGNPWVWRARFPTYHAEADLLLVQRGFHIAYIKTDGLLGCPQALRHWDAFYDYATSVHKLAKKPALEAVSRGGLFAYRWAAKNADRVACIYADTPVCDFKSWPLGQGDGLGARGVWKTLLKVYEFSEEEALAYRQNPIDVLAPIAEQKVPLLHIISLNDKVVPPKENTLVLAERYRKLGGSIEIIEVEEGPRANGHHFDHPDPKRVADFIEKHATAELASAPTSGDKPKAKKTLQGSRPNIVLILTDDQGMGDLSCMGNTILKTPHIDRLYEKSTRFTDFQVSPTCSPTRAAMMSGRYPFEVGVSHTLMQRDRLAPAVVTFPQALQQAGYQTGLFGKWHLGDGAEYLPGKRGFHEVLMHGAGGIGQYGFGDFQENSNNKYFDNVLLHNDTIVKTKGFCTDLFFEAALGWMKQQYDSDQPFFTYLSLNAPHGPLIAPEKYKKRFLDDGYDNSTAARYGMIENIDDNVGILMQKLNDWDALEDTLVIFMTDNGMAMKGIGHKTQGRLTAWNAGMRGTKDTNWQGGTRVPAFWHWPAALDEGVDIPALTAHLDLYRTFCALADAPIPESSLTPAGRSLIPLLEDPQADWAERTIYSHRGRWGGGGRGKPTREEAKYYGASVRNDRWRLVFEMDSEGPWLSDIVKDPGETTNLYDTHPEVAAEMTQQFDAWWDASEPYLVNRGLPRISAGQHHLQLMYDKQLKEKGIPDWAPTAIAPPEKEATEASNSVGSTKPVRHLKNIAYDEHERTVLDFWQADGTGPRPLLIYIHGGGWIKGDKRSVKNVSDYLAQGISVASINYRLVPEHPLPAPVHDAVRAVQFLRHQADQWSIDKSKIALAGGSAGGCTALWIACHDDVANPNSADPVERESSRVLGAAVISAQTCIDPKVIEPWIGPKVFYPMIYQAVGEDSPESALANYTQHQATYQEFSPINHLTADDPPLFLEYSPKLPMSVPATSFNHGIHHPMFGERMKQKSIKTNHNQVDLYIKDHDESPRYSNAEDFLMKTLLSSAPEQAALSTISPAPSTLKKFMPRRHLAKLEEAKTRQIDFVMIGDSITHNWESEETYEQTFEDANLLNLGFAGDRTQNVLWRIHNGALDGISPKLVTLMIGTNHCHNAKAASGYQPDSAEDVFTGIQTIVKEIRTRLPKSKIVVFSVFPRKSPEQQRVEAINAILPKIADDPMVSHKDINHIFLDRNGNLRTELYKRDQLHLSSQGYAVWSKALKLVLQEYRIAE